MTAFLYYPGCSMDSSARAYQQSLDVVTRELDIRLLEIDDWNCCGATEYAGISLLQSHSLIARNLALAEAQSGRKGAAGGRPPGGGGKPESGGATTASGTGAANGGATTPSGGTGAANGGATTATAATLTVEPPVAPATDDGAATAARTLVAPCSACYLNLAKTDAYMRESPTLSHHVNEALGQAGLSYTPGAILVRHLLDVLLDDVGIDAIAGRVTRPLRGLRIAPYLGCMLPRPDLDGRWPVREHPVAFDRLLGALGAEVVDFPLKTDCCGGHMTQISPGTGFDLIRRLVHEATARRADVMATVCPMCQMNIDAFQGEMNRYFRTQYSMPILFFTQLMGLAFGAEPAEVGIGVELVPAAPALARIGVEAPPADGEAAAGPPSAARRPSSRRSKALPMPRMAGQESRR